MKKVSIICPTFPPNKAKYPSSNGLRTKQYEVCKPDSKSFLNYLSDILDINVKF